MRAAPTRSPSCRRRYVRRCSSAPRPTATPAGEHAAPDARCRVRGGAAQAAPGVGRVQRRRADARRARLPLAARTVARRRHRDRLRRRLPARGGVATDAYRRGHRRRGRTRAVRRDHPAARRDQLGLLRGGTLLRARRERRRPDRPRAARRPPAGPGRSRRAAAAAGVAARALPERGHRPALARRSRPAAAAAAARGAARDGLDVQRRGDARGRLRRRTDRPDAAELRHHRAARPQRRARARGARSDRRHGAPADAAPALGAAARGRRPRTPTPSAPPATTRSSSGRATCPAWWRRLPAPGRSRRWWCRRRCAR